MVQILARRSKNNPILLGDPGVGKTAIAEGLATAIVTGVLPDGSPLPSFLEGKRVLSLDLGLVLAGAKERGELENRITKMLAEIDACGDVILMIDEIHSLVGAGSAGGRGGGGGAGMDIANLLKPPLARGGRVYTEGSRLTPPRTPRESPTKAGNHAEGDSRECVGGFPGVGGEASSIPPNPRDMAGRLQAIAGQAALSLLPLGRITSHRGASRRIAAHRPAPPAAACHCCTLRCGESPSPSPPPSPSRGGSVLRDKLPSASTPRSSGGMPRSRCNPL